MTLPPAGTLPTVALGATGLPVTRLGLGLAAIGRPAYINLGRDRDVGDDRSVATMRARSHELLDAATAAGIRYLDVARSYGYAESFLASWLATRDPATTPITVGSKWGYRYVGEWRMDAPVHEVKDHSLAMLREQVAESRRLLDPWLRLYQIHSATFESGVLANTGVLRELCTLREAGLAIGLTVSGANQADVVRAALDVRIDGASPFETVQATWNLLEPSAGPALAEAHAAGLGVIVKEALANGRLLRGAARAALDAVAARRGVAADAVALAAVLAQPWVHVVLSGAVTSGELESNLAGLAIRLAPDDLRELSELGQPASAYWSERSALAWT